MSVKPARKNSPLTIPKELFKKTDEKKNQKAFQLKKLFKRSVKEWCENTTSHGFSNMIRTDSWIVRIVWLILIFAFMGYCIFSNFKTITYK